MSKDAEALEALIREIEAADSKKRLSFLPKLSRLIDDMEDRGEAVPTMAKCVHEELINEKIEAQFDNMPI